MALVDPVESLQGSAFSSQILLVVVYHMVGSCGGSGLVARKEELRG